MVRVYPVSGQDLREGVPEQVPAHTYPNGLFLSVALYVPDGDQAWDALDKPDAPSIALLDWVMPGIDGVELCRRIKQSETCPSSTSSSSPAARDEGVVGEAPVCVRVRHFDVPRGCWPGGTLDGSRSCAMQCNPIPFAAGGACQFTNRKRACPEASPGRPLVFGSFGGR